MGSEMCIRDRDYRLSTDETRNLNQAMEIKMQEFDKVISQVRN